MMREGGGREEGGRKEGGSEAHNWGEVALLVPGCVGMWGCVCVFYWFL